MSGDFARAWSLITEHESDTSLELLLEGTTENPNQYKRQWELSRHLLDLLNH